MNIQTIHTKNLRWIDVVNPKADEVSWLRKHFRFEESHFEALIRHQERPHLDQIEGYVFLVLLFPVYNRKTGEILPGEVDFFVGSDFLLTTHYGEIHTLRAIFDKAKTDTAARNQFLGKSAGELLYLVLEQLFRRAYPILDHMSADVAKIEARLFHERNLNLLSSIAIMKKNIIEFRKMMKTHRSVLDRLLRQKNRILSFADSRSRYRALADYHENIWDILDALKETADALEQTNQTLETHRLNQITKMISLFSAILLPATLVAFIFGISVEGIPFRHHPHGFWIVVALMVLSSSLLVWFFKKKNWL